MGKNSQVNSVTPREAPLSPTKKRRSTARYLVRFRTAKLGGFFIKAWSTFILTY